MHFWLQFQLTVNISAVTTALEGSFAYAKSPLAAIQLLWVNLLMDALESLALASEPPTDELLKRDPINRSRSIITNRMWGNMLGQSSYQIIVIMVLLFAGPEIFGETPDNYFLFLLFWLALTLTSISIHELQDLSQVMK